MKRRVVIVGNGTLVSHDILFIKPADYVIGVDRAAYWLIREGRVPDIAIGDFDSATKEEVDTIKKSISHIKEFPPMKDQTDMELAVLYAIEQKPSKVLILGGIGSRMDHTLATVHLLERLLSAKIPHFLVNEQNRIRLIDKGRTILKSGEGYRYVSIIPFTKLISVKLSGFRYDLPKTTIIRGSTRGISNKLTGGQGEITLFSGKAWIVESND